MFQSLQTQPESLVREVRMLSEFSLQALNQTGKQHGANQSRITKAIVWCKPQRTSVALNCDGSLKTNPLGAGAGCIIRNSEGEWLAGCCRNVGICTSL